MVHATLPRRKQLYERQKSDDEFLNRQNQRYDEVRAYDDAELLRVIESYCTSAKTRHTVNSLDLTKLSLEEREHALGAGVVGITATPAAPFYPQQQQQQQQGVGGALGVTPCHVPGCQHGATPGCEERHPIVAPDFRRQGGAAGGGFCCGAFPITKGIVKGLKRL